MNAMACHSAQMVRDMVPSDYLAKAELHVRAVRGELGRLDLN